MAISSLNNKVEQSSRSSILSLSAVQALAPLLAIIVLAVFARAWNLDALGWMPDHFDRQIDAQRLVSGHLPNSVIYPPGSALILAIPVALFGPSVSTGQWVAVLFSLPLIPMAYVVMWKATADRQVALQASLLCALTPSLVIPARSGYIDAMIVTLSVAAFLILPGLRSRSWPAFAAYGLLFALLFAIRPSNLALAVPIGVYWLALEGNGFGVRQVLRQACRPRILVCGAAAVVPSLAAVLLGNWFGGGYGNLVDLSNVPSHLAWYWWQMMARGILLPVLVPLSLLGAWRVRSLDRPLFLAVVTLLIVWPLVHAPFDFRDSRYMGLPFAFVLCLSAQGSVFGAQLTSGRWVPQVRVYSRWAMRVLVLLFGIAVLGLLARWPTLSIQSDEGLAVETRQVLSEVPPGSVVISAVNRAFAFDNLDIEYLDLFDQSIAIQNRPDAVRAVTAAAAQAMSEGREVYYLRSHFEVQNRPIGGIWDDLELYLVGLDERFDVTPVFETREPRGGKFPWVLFRISEPAETLPSPPLSPLSN